MSAYKHASLIFLPFRASVWGKKGCGYSSVDQCPEIEKGPARVLAAGVQLGPFVGDPPRGERLLKQGRERKQRTKAIRLVPYQRPRGRVEKRETETSPTPRIPPERLLNCVSTTSRRAPRLMEPARGVPPIAAALPPAAGQWRRVFLGRGRSRLLSLAVVCGLGLVRAPSLAALGP